MSFQGDVRGIGLAELLQGLARGQKEGVLTLTARGGGRSVLGMQDGRAWLLPDPDEDAERWRNRVRNAWADDPNFTVDGARMSQVVKAARLETLYALLDGGGVHFRFDPGSLPDRSTRLEEEGHSETVVHCDSIQVEYLLLEYARIADEFELAGHPRLVDAATIPCIAQPDELNGVPASMVTQIDGNSTLLEIADRLGWPVRQVQLAAMAALASGGLRCAHPIEVLRLALHELSRKQFARAAARLSLWCRVGPPGPLVAEDADALTNEWLAGRLVSALRLMPTREVRCLLRRLDASLGNTSHAVVHWTEALRIKPGDRIAKLRLAAMRLRDEGDGTTMDVREVLDLARELREHGTPMRSGPALAIAAHLQPDSVPQRLELGMGLVQARRVEEGAPWVVTACTDMLAQGHADRILGPLRTLIEQDPRNREARELLTRAKSQSTASRKLRRNLAIGVSIAVLAGAGAVVKVKVDKERSDKIAAIRQLLAQPEVGLAQLDAEFTGDDSIEIGDLRRELEERLRSDEIAKRTAWLDLYHTAQLEAQEGDVVRSVELARDLPAPPRLKLVAGSWPSVEDVLMGIPNRLREEVISLGYPSLQSPQQLVVETRVQETCGSLRATVADESFARMDVADFVAAVTEVEELVAQRAYERSVAQLDAERREALVENDRLLDLAHTAIQRNQFDRALKHYEAILENDTTGKVHRVLREEIADTRKKWDAVQNARKAAANGRHDKALQILDEVFEERVRVMLPFEVTTTPAGVQVTVTPEGTGQPFERTTPFTIEGTFEDRWSLSFDLPDFDRRSLAVEGPQDIDLVMSRTPELHYATRGRVDAVPAPIGDRTHGEYLVCDRNGNLARIAWDGTQRWTQQVKTLSGIARRPLPLPSRPEMLLFVTETGAVWLVNGDDGHLEGPWDLGEPPVLGPVAIGEEVHAQLRSGSLARWRTSLRPTTEPAGTRAPLSAALRYGDTGLFDVLRPDGSSHPTLVAEAAGSGWEVTVGETHFEVRPTGRPDGTYLVVREGEWRYAAWEAPALPGEPPTLWISDGAGLRAFLPPGIDRTVVDPESQTTPPAPEGLFPEAPVSTPAEELPGPVAPPPADGPGDGGDR